MYGYVCSYPDDGGAQGIGAEADCEELGYTTVTADLVWTGLGEVTRNRSTSSDQGEDFHFRSHTVQAVRDAAVTGVVQGGDLILADGGADFGILLRGAYRELIVTRGAE